MGVGASTTNGLEIVQVGHHTQTSQWIPPQESWTSTDNNHGNSLPYGWETGVDGKGKQYYINHVDKSTTREDPRDDPDYLEPPKPREIHLMRDAQLGFGFVAGSEKPVIVRFVTEGGPSEDLLMPDDQILKINNEDVEKAPRERVIELVRSCDDTITLTVCQPHTDNSARRSALLTAAKKARLKSNPSRVRFAESVTVNGSAVVSPSTHESYIPFMPNVLKVFLENGQTKSFKYDNKTTVKEVVISLQEKLNISAVDHFALVLQNLKGNAHRMTILQELDTLADIAARPDSSHFKCLFRLVFVPKDAYDLLQKDNISFDYFYTQCTNDVVQERFSSELKYDAALRLAALHIQQHYSATHSPAKLSLKNIERDTGLETFVPASILQSMRLKEIRKCLAHYIKVNQSLAPGQRQLTELQAKLHYLKILSHLKAFGGKCFIATFVEKRTEVMIVVGPTRGIAEATNIKTNTFQTLSTFEEIDSITLNKENDSMQQVILHLQDTAYIPVVTLSMLNEDVEEFCALVEGYYRLFVDSERSLLSGGRTRNNNTESEVVPYSGTHKVLPSSWSYEKSATSRQNSEVEDDSVFTSEETVPKVVDFAKGPPPYSEKEPAKTEQVEQSTDKPFDLPVGDKKVTTAPLASPDASTLSGSSDSSVQQTLVQDSPSDAEVSPSRSEPSESPSTPQDAHSNKDSDSVTDSSASTIVPSQDGDEIQGTSVPPTDDGAEQKSPMSRSLSAQDSRFGVASFKTFATSPKSSPVLQKRTVKMGQDSGSANANSPNAQSSNIGIVRPLEQGSDSDKVANHGVLQDSESSPSRKAETSVVSDSDTDSLSTPTASPAKGKLQAAKPQVDQSTDTERPQSFGLVSPDQLPGNEDQFKEVALSFGLHSPEAVPPAQAVHPSYNPRLFSDGALYLDPDIIDLTLLPPPKTPDEPGGLIDFTSPTSTLPPPGFHDGGSPVSPQGAAGLSPGSAGLPPTIGDLPSPIRHRMDAMIHNDEDLGNQLVVMDALLSAERQRDDNEKESGIFESESDSGNETISSENIEFSGTNTSSASRGQHSAVDTSDIDAFIASMVVPPPPRHDLQQVEPSTSTTLPTTTKSDALFGLLSLRSDGTFEQNSAPQTSTPKQSIETASQNTNVVALPSDISNTVGDSTSTTAQDADDVFISSLLSSTDFKGVMADDEIAKLIIPPPPSDSTPAEILVVPPVGSLESDTLKVDTATNSVLPYDSPTALEGTKLVDTLRAEYEKYNQSDPKVPTETRAQATVHQRSSSVPDDRAAGYEVGSPGIDCALPYKRALWRPTEVKSADSSPLHQPSEPLEAVPSTLPRILRKKKPPPPPPPRRSSMPPTPPGDVVLSMAESDESKTDRLKPVVHQRSLSVPDESARAGKSNSFTQGAKSSSSGYSTFGTRHSLTSPNYQNVYKNQFNVKGIDSVLNPSISESEPQVSKQANRLNGSNQSSPAKSVPSTFTPDRPNVASRSVTLDSADAQNLHSMLEVSRSVDSINLQAYKEYKRSSSSSSSDSSRSGTADSSRFQAFKSKLKSYVAPSIYKKQLILSRGGARDKDDDSEPRKSDYMSPSPQPSPSPSSAGAPKSPRNSPLLQRHSSFSGSESGTGSPKTFRTFLGDSGPQSESAPTSPLKTAGIRTSYPLVKADIQGLSMEQSSGSPKKVASPRVSIPVPPSPSSGRTTATTPTPQPPLLEEAHDVATIPRGKVLTQHRSGGDREPEQNGTKEATINGGESSPKIGALRTELKAKFEPQTAEANSKAGVRFMDEDKTLEMVAKEVLVKQYQGGETFAEADRDVDRLVILLDRMATLEVTSASQNGEPEVFQKLKDSLVSQSRTFVTESKLLVSSATQSQEKLVEKVNSSIHTLARIMDKTQQMVSILTAGDQVQGFTAKVKDVARAYKTTMRTAHKAAGKPLSDPNMKQLMKQATSLAAILSTFMKTLKALEAS